MAVRLSKRMEALAHLVTPSGRLCDVGCDHGYLPIYLVQEQIIPSAIAMDIGEGPLLAAKTHIAEVGLEDKIQTRRSDGLAAASAEEIDTVLIAGMGGGIVIHILTEGRKVAQSVKDLILQPQSELKEVRRFLCNEGYEIVDEDMVLEDGKYYPMMKVRYAPETKDRRQSVAEHDFLFGPMLLQKKHPVLHAYLLREERIQKEVLERLAGQKQTPAIEKRTQEVQAYLQEIQKCLW